jgi:hypothetical protein
MVSREKNSVKQVFAEKAGTMFGQPIIVFLMWGRHRLKAEECGTSCRKSENDYALNALS